MKNKKRSEKRKYIRLGSVFPIEFQLVSPDGNKIYSGWLQGFTHDIAKEGLCLIANNLADNMALALKRENIRLNLNINMPLFKKPTQVMAKCAWISRLKDTPPNQYKFGINYETTEKQRVLQVYNYARTKMILPKLILALFLAMVGVFSINIVQNKRLHQQNQQLLVKLQGSLNQAGLYRDNLDQINKEKIAYDILIKDKDEEISQLDNSLLNNQEQLDQEILRFKTLIARLKQEKQELSMNLEEVKAKEAEMAKDFSDIIKIKSGLENEVIFKMYHWLKNHQNTRTGLIASFEGDKELRYTAFIYDQALAAQVFLLYDDYKAVSKMLDFFSRKAKKDAGGFFNAYYASNGKPAEYVVHTGPNVWVGIAALQYMNVTGDKKYLRLVIDIGNWLIKLQNEDPDRGIKGGPRMPWFSTEHNLDAYALFKMLHEVTKDKKYLIAQQNCKNWIKNNAYSQAGVIKRGKGDSTIATDTYAWSIAAIGPGELAAEFAMDADQIMKFAEDNCLVKVLFKSRVNQAVEIEGFDFAKERHLPRGGVVSSEWTAQMTVAYKIMSEFYLRKQNKLKAEFYAKRYSHYLDQLGKMLIISPSPSGQGDFCLPYASQDRVDTGHGWTTPKGASTGSVAATAYCIFAHRGYNPLEFFNGTKEEAS